MRYRAACVSVCCLWLLVSGSQVEAVQAETLFKEAKILMFDKNWNAALTKIEELLADHPDSPLAVQALFYKGKCLAEQPGREEEALAVFKTYLSGKGRSGRLDEEAEIGIIDAAEKLYKRGMAARIHEIESRLKSSNRVVRYYAAFTLSYIEDRKTAARSVPVLKEILDVESNPELRDRAKIALLRVSPEALKAVEDRQRNGGGVLKIQVSEKGEMKIDINIPWALAQLALLAIPGQEKDLMAKKGYDIDRILSDLTRFPGRILEIRDGDTFIKISLEK